MRWVISDKCLDSEGMKEKSSKAGGGRVAAVPTES